MPEEEKKTVDIDTSGPETEDDIAVEKDESVIDTDSKEEPKEQETGTDETQEHEQQEEKRREEYSKGVQARK